MLESRSMKIQAPQMNTGSDYVRQKDFEDFTGFVSNNMVTKNEFTKAISEMVTKKEFTKAISEMVTKNEFEKTISRLEKKIDTLHHEFMNSMDYIVKYVDEKRTEDVAQVYINKRHETWIKGLAKHTKYPLAKDA